MRQFTGRKRRRPKRVDSDQYDAFAKSNESFSEVLVISVVKEAGNTMVPLFREGKLIAASDFEGTESDYQKKVKAAAP